MPTSQRSQWGRPHAIGAVLLFSLFLYGSFSYLHQGPVPRLQTGFQGQYEHEELDLLPAPYLPHDGNHDDGPTPSVSLAPHRLGADLLFHPIPAADGRRVFLVGPYRLHAGDNSEAATDRPMWPLREGREVWCKGDQSAGWDRVVQFEDTADEHEHVTVLVCNAVGSTLSLKLLNQGEEQIITVPLVTYRPAPSSTEPSELYVTAMTMIDTFDPKLPLWIEWHLSHGVERVYIYENCDNRAAATLARLLEPYVTAGLVVVVPWYRTYVEGFRFADPYQRHVYQQIIALNHALRTLDGYAKWIFIADLDEFPVYGTGEHARAAFTYREVLDAEEDADPRVATVELEQAYGRPAGAGIAIDEKFPKTVPVPKIKTVQAGDISVFSPLMARQRGFWGYPARSKYFVHPPRAVTISVHMPSAVTGSIRVLDPEKPDSMWLMHLSNHAEIEGEQVEFDFAEQAESMRRALGARYTPALQLDEDDLQ